LRKDAFQLLRKQNRNSFELFRKKIQEKTNLISHFWIIRNKHINV